MNVFPENKSPLRFRKERNDYDANEPSWARIGLSLLLVVAVIGAVIGGISFVTNRMLGEPKPAHSSAEEPIDEEQLAAAGAKAAAEEAAAQAAAEEAAAAQAAAKAQTPKPARPTQTPTEQPVVETPPVAKSGALAGKVIAIDPGHQAKANMSQEPVGPGASERKPKVAGGTSGVVSKTAESKVVLDIGLQLRDALERQGATVVMTRTKQDVDVPNSKRAAIANEAHADLFIRLHCDGANGSQAHGISMLVPAKNKWTEPIVASSKKAGECVQKAVIAATGAKNNGVVSRGDLSGFNYCKVPSILIEMGFMTNKEEDKKLNSAAYQAKLVQGLTQGCVDWLTR